MPILKGGENLICPYNNKSETSIEAQCKITPYAKVDTSLVGVPGDTKTVPSWNYIGDAEDVAEGGEIETTIFILGIFIISLEFFFKFFK